MFDCCRLLPLIIEHTIDERSPLIGHNFDSLMMVSPNNEQQRSFHKFDPPPIEGAIMLRCIDLKTCGAVHCGKPDGFFGLVRSTLRSL